MIFIFCCFLLFSLAPRSSTFQSLPIDIPFKKEPSRTFPFSQQESLVMSAIQTFLMKTPHFQSVAQISSSKPFTSNSFLEYLLFIQSLIKSPHLNLIGSGLESITFCFKKEYLSLPDNEYLPSSLSNYVFKIPLFISKNNLSILSSDKLWTQLTEHASTHSEQWIQLIEYANRHMLHLLRLTRKEKSIQTCFPQPFFPNFHRTFGPSDAFQITVQSYFPKTLKQVLEKIKKMDETKRRAELLNIILHCLNWYNIVIDCGFYPRDLSVLNFAIDKNRLVCFDFSCWSKTSSTPTNRMPPTILFAIFYMIIACEESSLHLPQGINVSSQLYQSFPSLPTSNTTLKKTFTDLKKYTHSLCHLNPHSFTSHLLLRFISLLQKNIIDSYKPHAFIKKSISFIQTELKAHTSKLPPPVKFSFPCFHSSSYKQTKNSLSLHKDNSTPSVDKLSSSFFLKTPPSFTPSSPYLSSNKFHLPDTPPSIRSSACFSPVNSYLTDTHPSFNRKIDSSTYSDVSLSDSEDTLFHISFEERPSSPSPDLERMMNYA